MHKDKISQYHRLVARNELIVDQFWKKHCFAVNIQFLLPTPIQKEFSQIQQFLLQGNKEALRKCPTETLHISVAFLIGVKQTYSHDRQELWENIESRCLHSIEHICKKQKAFTITFNRLVATDSAIIIVGTDCGEMQKVRHSLVSNVPIPKETSNGFDIIHSTLFRYRGPLDQPAKLLNYVNCWSAEIPVNIDGISVIKEFVYPSLKIEPIKSFRFIEHGK